MLGTGPSIIPYPTTPQSSPVCVLGHATRWAEPAYPVEAEGYHLWDSSTIDPLGETLGHPTFGSESRATLEWLDGALRDARSRGQVSVGTYLEAVLEEVLFEMEPEATS